MEGSAPAAMIRLADIGGMELRIEFPEMRASWAWRRMLPLCRPDLSGSFYEPFHFAVHPCGRFQCGMGCNNLYAPPDCIMIFHKVKQAIGRPAID